MITFIILKLFLMENSTEFVKKILKSWKICRNLADGIRYNIWL